uniref:SET domain-containing protein n=1 Tax=Caenorhabditis tropicalis TaxID=1561998 RepID=A0A1I7U1W3_9PELO
MYNFSLSNLRDLFLVKTIVDSKDFQANHYLMEINANWTTDATRYGNITRYINHSCDPNSQSYTYIMYDLSEKDGRFYYDKRNIIKTMKEIKNTIITYDYCNRLVLI